MEDLNLRGVTARLKRLRRLLLLRILIQGTSRTVFTGLGLALVTFLLDWGLRLPGPVRGVLLALSIGAVLYVAFRHLLRPLLHRPDLDQLALMVEASDPGIGEQLISAVQLERDLEEGRAVESPALIRALVADTAERFRDRSFASAVTFRPCIKPLGAAGIMVVACSTLALLFPLTAGLWVQRQLLLRDVPWPRETTLVITIPDIEKYDPKTEDGRTLLHIPERTPLQVQVTAEGRLPDEVELITAPLDDEEARQTISMGRPKGKDYFQHIFPPLTRSLLFHVEGGDDRDEVPLYELKVARAPRVLSFWADYDYPDYTGLTDRTLPDANISAPEGTRITMHFRVNMVLADFDLEFDALGPIDIESIPDGTYRHSFLVEHNDFYSYRLKGRNGVISADVPRYVITAEVDQPPRVSVLRPAHTVVPVTARATLPLMGSAHDDYGVTEVGIRWGEGRGALDHGSITFTEEDILQPAGSRELPFFHALRVSDLKVPGAEGGGLRPAQEGDELAFRFIVADNRRTPGEPEPHRPFGDYEYRVQVLSPEELERELSQRQGRMRERIRSITNLVESRIDDTRALLQSVESASEGPGDLRTRLWQVEQDQNRITVELQTSTRHFLAVYDGYLLNRLDPGNLTEKTIDTLVDLHRARWEGKPSEIYGEAIAKVRPLVDESSLMGRLTVILDLLLRASTERSPEAYRQLARAGLVAEPEQRAEQLRAAIEMQELLLQDMMLLVEKLEAWENFLDVIQGFRDLMELEAGVQKKIEKLTNK